MAKSDSEVIREHFRLADRFLKTARLSQRDGDWRTAADRAYYAMFHAASAALYQRGIIAKSHKGLISQFSKEYIKPGLIDPELSRSLRQGFSLRQASDYELYAIIEEEQVEELVVRAQEFVAHLKKLLSVS